MSDPQHIDKNNLLGCPGCDLLLRKTCRQEGHNILCPRCGTMLVKSCTDSINRTLALSLSGLMLFFPACFLPIISLDVIGRTGYCTMIKGVVQMFANGYWWMSFLVLFCSVLVPFLALLLLSAITLSAKIRVFPPGLRSAIKLYRLLHEWTMLDVYMIGILIAFIKMQDYGDIFTGPGFYCFCGLLLVQTMAALTFDSDLIWNRIEVLDM